MRKTALFWALATVGCVSTDPDRVQLEARVESVDLAVEKTTLVTVLSGGFDIVLSLGDLASASRTVDRAPTLALVKESDRSLVRKIDALPDGNDFPVTIAAGGTSRIGFTLTMENTLAAEQFDSACAAPVVVAGTVEDSDTSHAIPFQSEAVTLQGCP